jgi:hypothetical protein
MEELAFVTRLRQIYADYLDDIERLQASLKPLEGILGFGRSPGKDPCHARFADAFEKALADFAAQAPASGAVSQVLGFVYELAQDVRPGTSLSYWMLLAVHGLTAELTDCLSEADAARLYRRYLAVYPRRIQLPVQQEIAKRLRRAAGAAVERRRGLSGFFGRHGR